MQNSSLRTLLPETSRPVSSSRLTLMVTSPNRAEKRGNAVIGVGRLARLIRLGQVNMGLTGGDEWTM